ncbi:MAG TPA: hypothetical protein VII08_19560 [Myxococcales bacterium]
MCTFVLGTLPASAPLKSLERDFFRFTEVNAGSVASVLPPGELFGRMTGRHCDCGTALGIAAKMDRIAEHNRESIEHKLDRLQRKGWSRTRIERWLAQVEADQDRHAKVKADGAADKARVWRDWLHHALEVVGVEHVGLLVDDYDGLLDDAYTIDEKPAPSVRELRVDDVDEGILERVEKGVLYRVRR